jgi:large subunit ribosomal protein L32
MPVPRRRHCPARRDRRRANEKLAEVQGLFDCEKCGKPRLPHRACASCGEYKGRTYGKVKPVTAE